MGNSPPTTLFQVGKLLKFTQKEGFWTEEIPGDVMGLVFGLSLPRKWVLYVYFLGLGISSLLPPWHFFVERKCAPGNSVFFFLQGVDSPFFSIIGLLPFSPGFWRFSAKKDPWTEWARYQSTFSLRGVSLEIQQHWRHEIAE